MPSKKVKDMNERFFDNLKIFMDVALHGPLDLLTEYGTPLEVKEKFSKYKIENAREYILSGMLTEIQHCFFIFLRRHEYLKELKDSGKPIDNPAIAMEISCLVNEQNLWQRKFVEILSSLILFSQVNEQSYFFHYLLVYELEELNRQQREQKVFFGSESPLRAVEISKLTQAAEAIEKESRFEIDKCWYLSDDTKKNIKAFKPNVKRKLQSLTEVVKTAILVATAGERVALGFYQKYAYSITSQNIHFTPLRTDAENDFTQLRFGISQLGLLVPRIVSRSEQILRLNLEKRGCILARELSKDVASRQPFAQTAEPGDYVMIPVNGREYIAAVVEVFKSNYGYEGYRVRYVANQPEMPPLVEDIIAGNACGKVVPKSAVQEILQETTALLKNDLALSDPALLNRLTSPEVTQQALDQTMLELWDKLFRHYRQEEQ